MRLYDALPSPNAKRVRVLARELGISLERITVDLRASDPGYLQHNPMGKVPTLVDDDGYVLWESGAILTYLASKHGSALLPSTARGLAEVMRPMFFAATHIQPWISTLGQERIVKPARGGVANEALIAHAEAELARFLPVLDRALAGREYLCGTFSIADIFVGCGLEGAERRGVELTPYAALCVWRARLQARAAWAD